MSFTLKVVVNPYESSEESEKQVEDRNVYLVRLGLPSTEISTGFGTAPKKNIESVDVQQVVVFECHGTKVTPTQIEFLEQLKEKHVIKTYEQYNDQGKLIE